MDKFGKILSEVWEEWTKDTTVMYYVVASKETMKDINLDLAHHNYKSTVTYKGVKTELTVWKEIPLTALRLVSTEFSFNPSLAMNPDGKVVVDKFRKSFITFIRNDSLPKGVVSLKRKSREDTFLE